MMAECRGFDNFNAVFAHLSPPHSGNSATLRISMKDLREVQTQLERALRTLMAAAEQQPDADLAEAVDHVGAALTRIRAAEDDVVSIRQDLEESGEPIQPEQRRPSDG
jgi:hypothetical protein